MKNKWGHSQIPDDLDQPLKVFRFGFDPFKLPKHRQIFRATMIFGFSPVVSVSSRDAAVGSNSKQQTVSAESV